MTKQVTSSVLAMLMLLPVTVLATRVRQCHRIVARLLISTTVALVGWQVVLSISIVAVGTSPGVKGTHHFGLPSLFPLLRVISCFLDVVLRNFLLLLDIPIIVVSLIVGLESLDPPFDATKMERLVALLAVPHS